MKYKMINTTKEKQVLTFKELACGELFILDSKIDAHGLMIKIESTPGINAVSLKDGIPCITRNDAHVCKYVGTIEINYDEFYPPKGE